MILLRYKNELFRFFIYIFTLFVFLFIFSNVFVYDEIIDKNEVETNVINNAEDENTKIYVEYPRFKNDKINEIITNYVYSFIKEFKSNKNENKVLDMTYELYYVDDFVNIVFYIENSLDNVKNKNIIINLKDKKIAYISNLYDENYLKKEILDLVYHKYSTEIYDIISNNTINNFTYILSDSKISVYFNNIKFENIDYIPYVEIIINDESSVIENTTTGDKFIAFTYDDGPGEYTNDLLKTLQLNNSSATFFMLGNRMENYKEVVLKIYQSNSEIGSHSYNHKDLTKLDDDELINDLYQTNEIFHSITQDNLKYLRPPYNYNNEKILNTGYIIVTWNIDPKDWLVKDSTKIYNNVIKNACDGCIVIMHDIYEETIEATKMLLPKLNEMGYKIVSVSQLIKEKNYNIDSNTIISNIK